MKPNRKYGISRLSWTIITVVLAILSVVGLYFQTGYVRVTHYDPGSTTDIDSSAISLQKADILSVIPTPLQPTAMAYDPDNGMVYVSTGNGSSPAIDVISDSNNTIVATISFTEQNPAVLVFDNLYNNLYAYDSSQGDVIYVINPDTNEIIGNISTGTSGAIGGAAYDPNNQDLYVAGGTTNSLIVISTASDKVFQTVSIQGNPSFVAYDPNNGYVYVETQNMIAGSEVSNAITIVNPLAEIPALSNTVVSTLELPTSGAGICYVPETGNVYALTNSPAVISVINSQTNGISSSVFLPANFSFGVQSSMTYDPLNQLLFIATGNDSVTEFNPETNSLVGLQLPSQSGAVAIDTVNGNVYASTYATNEVVEFSP